MTSEKVESKSLPDFTQYVREKLVATVSKALAAGITETEIDAIIASNYNEHKIAAISRVITRIKKQIYTNIEIKSATAVKGLLIGCRDKSGKPGPLRYLLIKKDGKHIEISNFGHTTVFKDNPEYKIPIPSLVTLRITPDPEYNTWKLVGIESIDNPELTKEKIASVLKTVQIDPKTISKDFAWSKDTPAIPVVIYGKITRINPEVVFGRDENDRVFVESTNPILAKDEQDTIKPCFNFNIKSAGGKFIRCHIEHQKFGSPVLLIEDLQYLCQRGVEKHPTDPTAQAKFLEEWVGGDDGVAVFVAGVVSSYRETVDKKTGKDTTNIEIGCVAVVETEEQDPSKPILGSQETLPTPAPAPAPTPAPAPAPTPAPAPESKPTAGQMMIDSIASDIKLWCSAANVDPASLTLDILRTKATGRYSDVTDGIIVAAIDRIKRGK